MDAWGYLLEHSTALSGSDAWEHLIAQAGGGTACGKYVSEHAIMFDMKVKELKFIDTPIEMLFDEEER